MDRIKLTFLSFFVLLVAILFASSAVYAVPSLSWTEFDNETNAQNWATSSGYTTLLDFEDYPLNEDPATLSVEGTETGGESNIDVSDDLGSGVEFWAVEGPGQGNMSYDKSDAKIGINKHYDDGTYGRTHKWDDGSFFGDQYLESGDVELVSLNSQLVDHQYKTLSFFLFDVDDQGGTMTIWEGEDAQNPDDTSYSFSLPQFENGSILRVDLFSDSYLREIDFAMDSSADGYGIDNVGQVPEPTTMLLFGTGLLGLAAFGRKKYMKIN